MEYEWRSELLPNIQEQRRSLDLRDHYEQGVLLGSYFGSLLYVFMGKRGNTKEEYSGGDVYSDDTVKERLHEVT